MPLEHFDLAQCPVTRWRNGGGATREIACGPAGAAPDTFDWRVSVARIDADGPFSVFPGIDRVILLLDGPGVRLTSRDGTVDHVLDRPLRPFSLAGEALIDARRLRSGSAFAAPSYDFNVMTRRAALQAEVRVWRQAGTLARCGHGLLFAATGSWQLQQGGVLAPGHGLWWQGSTKAWTFAPADPVDFNDLDDHDRPGVALVSVCWKPVQP